MEQNHFGWIFLNVGNFHDVIKGQPDNIYNGAPWNWYIEGKDGRLTQKRLISLWGAPLTAGAVLLMPCMYYTINFFKNRCFFVRKLTNSYFKEMGSFVICVVALYMTITRQIVLPYIGIALLIFIYYNRKNNKILIAGILLFAPIIGIVFFEVFWNYIYNGSTMTHIIRIQNAIEHLSFWGMGVGTFGTRFSGSIATESQYITVLGQLGIIPLGLYFVIFMYPMLYCKKRMKFLNKYSKTMICSLCFSSIVYMIAGTVSETVAAFTSIAQYDIFIGFSWGYCRQFQMESVEYEDKSNCDVLTTISQNT